MDRNLWNRLYLTVASTACPDPAVGVTHPDRRVVLVYLWAAGHRKPTSWACDPDHWEPWARLPSQPTMSRRLRAAPVGRLLAALCRRFRGAPRAGWVKWVDGFPLPVGNDSHDPDATTGYGAGGFFRGYKLHAVWGAGPAPLAFEVHPAHRAEPRITRVLAYWLGGGGYRVGDAGVRQQPAPPGGHRPGGTSWWPRPRSGGRAWGITPRSPAGSGPGSCWAGRSGGRCTPPGRRSSGGSAGGRAWGWDGSRGGSGGRGG